MADLERLLERLVQHEVEFVLVGGYAAMIHGVSLLTRDIDVCAQFSRCHLERIHAAVADLHPYHFLTPQPLAFEIPEGLVPGLKNLYIGTDLGRVEFIGEVAGVGNYQSVFDSSIAVQLPFGTVRVINRSALIAAKSVMDRPRDRIALIELKAIAERHVPEPS
jgi:hypothetical protein